MTENVRNKAPFFGPDARHADNTTLKRIVDMAARVEDLGLTLDGCMTHAITIAESWMKKSTERATQSGIRCWQTFCNVFEVPVLIQGLPTIERERLGIAFVGYMIKTIKPARATR